jgi:ribosome biogenesis GTPase
MDDITIKTLGWDRYTAKFSEFKEKEESEFARVIVENKTNYVLFSNFGELQGIARGKMLQDASGLPKVGDWVKIQKLQAEDKAVIEQVLPRLTAISRASSLEKNEQLIAANVDVIFIVQGLDGNFNLRRLERYVATARESGCKPVVVLNKADVAENIEGQIQEINKELPDVPVFLVSASTGQGMEELKKILEPQLTVAFMGSSGVGKSSLINSLAGEDILKTAEVRVADGKGKHTTTRRQLVVLPNGSLLIDTPGMREMGLWATEEAVSSTFEDIETLATECEFTDCDHKKSSGCALLLAIKTGTLTLPRYNSYMKLQAEASYIKAKQDPKEMIKRKNKWKKIKRDYKQVLRNEY